MSENPTTQTNAHLEAYSASGTSPTTTVNQHSASRSSNGDSEVYEYRDKAGKVIGKVICSDGGREIEPLDSNDSVRPSRIASTVYRLPELQLASSRALIFVVGSEKLAEGLAKLELVATTACGGFQKWNVSHTQALEDREVVIDCGRL